MKKTKRIQQIGQGFTVIELMIIVGILAVLAAVAIPAYITYMKRSKASEAAVALKAMCKGSQAYFTRDIEGVTNRLPAAATQTPAENPGEAKYDIKVNTPEFQDPGTTNGPTWMALGWSPLHDFYYAYSYEQNCQGADDICRNGLDGYTGIARGNLDGDETYSLFTIVGIAKEGQMTCGAMASENPTE